GEVRRGVAGVVGVQVGGQVEEVDDAGGVGEVGGARRLAGDGEGQVAVVEGLVALAVADHQAEDALGRADVGDGPVVRAGLGREDRGAGLAAVGGEQHVDAGGVAVDDPFDEGQGEGVVGAAVVLGGQVDGRRIPVRGGGDVHGDAVHHARGGDQGLAVDLPDG